jgi:hypothetical protein
MSLRGADGRRAELRGFARNRSRYNLQLQDASGRFHLLNQRELREVQIDGRRPCRRPSAATAAT